MFRIKFPQPTQLLLLILTVGVWGLLLNLNVSNGRAATIDSNHPMNASFETINVERINVVDPDGTLRLAIGNRAHPPEARIRGKVFERSIDDMIGLVFYQSNGDEAGGLGLARLRDRNQSMFILDYTHQITDGIGLIKQESEDGETWKAGFFVSDRRPYKAGEVESSQGVERIWLSNEDGAAALVISDPDGRPRIRIGVDEVGEPSIQIMDEAGKLLFDADKYYE